MVSLGLFAGLSNYYNAFTLIFNFIVAHMAV
nr:hypothetical protein [Allorhizobium sonneratiae]